MKPKTETETWAEEAPHWRDEVKESFRCLSRDEDYRQADLQRNAC